MLKAVGDFASAKMLRDKRVPLRVKVKTIREGTGFYCISHDVSITGILIETEEKIEVSERLYCYFTLLDFGSVETEGEVVRYERTLDGGYKYGIQFCGLTREDRLKIDQYVTNALTTRVPPDTLAYISLQTEDPWCSTWSCHSKLTHAQDCR